MRSTALLVSSLLVLGCAEGEGYFVPDAGARRDSGKPSDAAFPDEDAELPADDTAAPSDSGGCTPPAGKVCTTFPQCGCSATQNCNVTTTAGKMSCVARGSAKVHEKCSAIGDCDVGLQCIADVCVPFCDNDGDCTISGSPKCMTVQVVPDGATTPVDVPGLRVCHAQCDPLSPSACGASNGCTFFYGDGTTGCTAAGSGTTKGACASDPWSCAPGYICVDPSDCLKWCRIGFPSDCTGTSGTCTSFTTPFMKGGVEYGVCAY